MRARRTRKIVSGGKLNVNNHVPVYPPKSINDLISHVIYINLDKREDRRKHIERELSVFDPSKLTRVPGVVEDHGNLGCIKSHLNAVKLAIDKKYPNVLIVEDDAIWHNVDAAYPTLERVLKEKYDGIMLGALNPNFNKETLRLHSTLMTTGYILKEHYYPEMLKLFEEGVKSNPYSDWATKTAQENHTWYITDPTLMRQIPSFSNIDKINVNWK